MTWCNCILPSKALILWRILHNVIPTDENQHNHEETTPRLFFNCSFASKIWNSIFSNFNIHLAISNIADCWKVIDRGWSPYYKVVIMVGIRFVFAKFGLQEKKLDLILLLLIRKYASVTLLACWDWRVIMLT